MTTLNQAFFGIICGVVCCSSGVSGQSNYKYADQDLFSIGQRRVYTGANLEAIRFPVGGIGAGSIHMDGQGVRNSWAIFGQYYCAVNPPDKQACMIPEKGEIKAAPTYMAYVPDSFFAVRVVSAGEPVVRVMQTVKEGAFKPFARLEFSGEYPFAWYRFDDPAVPVNVSLEAYNPLIPLNVRDSAIPCAIYNITVDNSSDRAVEVSVLAVQQNAVGYTGLQRTINGRRSGASGGNINEVLLQGRSSALHMTTARPPDDTGYGDMVLAVMADGVSATADSGDIQDLYKDFLDDGKLSGLAKAGPTPDGLTINGALSTEVKLAPGERRTIPFVLTWYMPNQINGSDDPASKTAKMTGGWRGDGAMYSNWWRDAGAVADYVIGNYERLDKETRLYHDSLYSSNLPRWFIDRISSQVVSMRTSTTWWAKNGYFGGWEGSSAGSGSCPGNCNHVWQYAQSYARLFPEIARTMREQEFHSMYGGAIPFRQSSKEIPQKDRRFPALDGQCGGILGVYREYLIGTDVQWLKKMWPDVREAMGFVIKTWDKDEDGVLSGLQHTTLDCKVGGSTSWLGSLYLSALRACREMAVLNGDNTQFVRYGDIAGRGSATQAKTLFNGEYYQQVLDGNDYNWYVENNRADKKENHPAFRYGNNYSSGCIADQLLGQWWADQLGLGTIYPRGDEKTAMRNLFKYNFKTSFENEEYPLWVAKEDAGLVNCVWPRNADAELKGQRRLGYSSCVLTGFEYASAAEMIWCGLLKEGFTVVKAIHERYNGKLKTGIHKSAWGYSGNPFGDDESGKFYARSQSSWSLLLACQGYMYDGPRGRIGFKPMWRPADHASFFTTAEGWGLYRQKVNGLTQTASIDLRYGRLAVRELVFNLEVGIQAGSVKVTGPGGAVQSGFNVSGTELTVRLNKEFQVESPAELHVHVSK